MDRFLQPEKKIPGFRIQSSCPGVLVSSLMCAEREGSVQRFGIKSKGPGAMVELCARIGLDFDKDPKWDYITKFIAKDPKNYVSIAINYIDWTVFGKTHARTGTRITDWLMRRAHPGLPYPKKPYPKLND